jgi:hypothetical protein
MTQITQNHSGCDSFIIELGQIFDSYDRTIQPLAAARDRGPYDPTIDPPKTFLQFDRKLFNTLTVLIIKDRSISSGDLLIRSNAVSIPRGRNLLRPLV